MTRAQQIADTIRDLSRDMPSYSPKARLAAAAAIGRLQAELAGLK